MLMGVRWWTALVVAAPLAFAPATGTYRMGACEPDALIGHCSRYFAISGEALLDFVRQKQFKFTSSRPCSGSPRAGPCRAMR
jgi:hypothetical protein